MANTHDQQRIQCPINDCPFRDQIQRQGDQIHRHEEELDGHGETIDHIMNTLDTIVIPTQTKHSEAIARHERVTDEASQFMSAWTGIRGLLTTGFVIAGALAAILNLVMRATGK